MCNVVIANTPLSLPLSRNPVFVLPFLQSGLLARRSSVCQSVELDAL